MLLAKLFKFYSWIWGVDLRPQVIMISICGTVNIVLNKMRELTKIDRKWQLGRIRDLGDFHLSTEHLSMFQKDLFLAMPELVLC